MIDAAEHWFRQVGCAKLEVTSGDHRRAAHHFYERQGFPRGGQRLSKKLYS
ncbi:GNAT family N-acetyltransferase [Burkholderia seminalis]|uniref:GNAT family N-acetyltransferase n=1 Tax=Burkholderia seminalis TaxID=488731 RepID=UPI001FC7FE65|nr:GNAT family N-acetyltransferase [Burkholderia seminalis]